MMSVHKELAAVAAEVAAVNKAMHEAAQTPSGKGLNTRFIQDYAKKVSEVESAFRSTVAAQGDFGIQSMKVASQADRLTEMIQRQKFGLRDLISEHKNLGEVYRQQISLQKSMVMQWGRDSSGAIRADLITPRTLESTGKGWREVARQAGFYNQVLSSVSDQTIKWGKNTQWAGRQLMAGLSIPIAAAAAGTGALAYQLDKGLTQVVKVYGDAATAASTSDAEIKQATMNTARSMASSFGQSAKDSIEITSQLASAGKTGRELQESTAQVTRARTLGELNLQDAMKATITLQSVYNMNSQKLGETFDFMNSMENQTNLTMQDFVVGIPKVSGVLKEFGGTVQDAGVLLAGMKAAGIDAAEGANAIKSIAFKVISPNAGARDLFQQLTGKSFDATMKGVDGVVDRLTVLGKSIQGLSEEQRVGLIQKMFGLYQGSKTLSLLSQLTNGSQQMTQAFEVAEGGAAQWAATAQRELEKLQNSGWNKLKQQWETLKIELADVGKTFLEMGAPILKAVSDMVTAFNDLDPGMKKFILIGAIAAAAVGPIIMLAGLMGNLIGNIGKLTTFLVGLGLKFKILTSEEVISSRLANSLTEGKFKEAEAFRQLASQMEFATRALGEYNLQQILANRGLAGAFVHPKTGAVMRRTATGKAAPLNKAQQKTALDTFAEFDPKAAVASGIVAENADKTRKSWSQISGSTKAYAVAGVAGTTAMIAPSGTVVSNLANAAFIGATLVPLVGKIGFVSNAVGLLGTKTKAAGAAMKSFAAPATTMVSRMGGSLAGLLPAIAPIAAGFAAVGAAAGAAFYVMHKNIEKTKKEAQEFADSAKTYADVLGFNFKQAAGAADATGKHIDTLDEKFKKFSDSNAGAMKRFQSMIGSSEDDKLQAATMEAVKARLHGASEQQGVEAAQIALRAMQSKISDTEVAFKLKGKLDLGDMDQVINYQIRNIQASIDRAVNNTKQGKSETFMRWLKGSIGINEQSKVDLQNLGKDMWETFAAASETQQPLIFKRMTDDAEARQKEMFETLRKAHEAQFKAYNINTAEDLAKFSARGGAMAGTGQLPSSSVFAQRNAGPFANRGPAGGLGLDVKQIEAWKKETDSAIEVVRAFGKQAGLTDEQLKNVYSLDDIKKLIPSLQSMGAGLQDVSVSQQQWTDFLKESDGSIVHWTESEKLARLNLYRRRAGLADATSVEQGFGDAVKESTKALDANAQAASDRAAFASAMNTPSGIGNLGASTTDGDQLVGAYKDAFSGAMDTVYSEASRIMDEQNDAVMNGIEKRGDAARDALDRQQTKMEKKFDLQNEAFDARWDKRKKTIENAYDARVAKVDEAIKAEQKAEDIRQKIFEAEKTRIQRLSEMYNRNIDINAAITTGNLDEAAKLQNDSDAAQQGWLLEDAQGATANASDARVEALGKQKDAIGKAKDAALDLADTQRKAEEKALKATQDAEKDKLDARKKALDQSIKNEEDGARRKYEANKRALDMELAVLKAAVPQNEAQLKAHIGRVEAAYAKYGVSLERSGKGWGNTVGNALTNATQVATVKMSNNIAWGALGKVAADKMSEGAFNMNLNEFMKWIMTGTLPKKYQAPSATLSNSDIKRITGGDPKLISDLRHQGLHSGGVVGGSQGSRTGYSGSGQSQSEVWINALKGEAVLNRSATRSLGTDFVDMANKGMIPKNIGGPDLLTGMSGVMSVMLGGALRKAMGNAILSAGVMQQLSDSGAAGMDYTATGKAGKYGDWSFAADQIRNAGIIASTGKSLGASNRDIIIALMTALQESTLRNVHYGDRDSLGLFQQRAAWGSEADRMNPAKSARMFFLGGRAGQRGLFDFPNRAKMSLAEAAQAVQVSAFPGAYAKWQNEAAALLSGLSFTSSGAALTVGSGGWVRPASGPRTSPFGYRIHPITGKRTLHAGSDIGAGMGAAIHAAKSGRVVSTTPTSRSGGYGNYTVIDHGGGIRTAYAHQSRFGVKAGQSVKAGQTIGYVGSTGASTGPHLHFEYLQNGVRKNPGLIIPGLETGGFTMSDGLAMLHKNETVLTAPLSDSLKDGINNMDKSQHFGYNVNMNFNGAKFNSDIDFEKGVVNALLAIEKHVGTKRKVGK
jgi:TP901 family phage tail tape measure protein